MQHTPSISVIVPTYNLEDCLAACLESVLGQTSPADEIIVVDDGSTDRTVEIAESYPVKVLRQKNSGPAAARNRGVREARGEWVAFLDGDDEWMPTKIEKLREKIRECMDFVLVATDDLMGPIGGPYKSRPLHLGLKKDDDPFRKLYRGCFFATSTISTRRAVFLEAGGMDESLRSAQDYDTWLRIVRLGAVGFISQPLTKYHIRPGSISFNTSRRLECSLIIADRYAHLVPFSLYLYRIALIFYEAMHVRFKHGEHILALWAVILMPFSVIRRLGGGLRRWFRLNHDGASPR
ncbi:MAG: glycosyltransferase family 2 protein [Bdellovibrionales bacterium]|nr:glycosyltransferase family 2 protein [Bdellovibrionales bacterium]